MNILIMIYIVISKSISIIFSQSLNILSVSYIVLFHLIIILIFSESLKLYRFTLLSERVLFIYIWQGLYLLKKSSESIVTFSSAFIFKVTFDDFTRLKPLLVARGWSFGPYTYRGAWLVRGERGARPNSETTSNVVSKRNEGDARFNEELRLLSSIMMPWSGPLRSGEEAVQRLCSACMFGDILVVKAELDRGAGINSRLNFDGDTLLTKSIMHARTELACWLLDRGADPELGLYNGRTPLMTAAGCGNLKVVEKLVYFGVDVNTQMKNGATALMYAVSKNQLHVARFLIRSGASRSLRDNEGWSIEDFARRSGVDISCLYN